jgi:zinc transporter, ZIP family
MLDRFLRRVWLLGVPAGVAVAAVVIGFARPWDNASSQAGEVTVERATLRPGRIILVLANRSEETARIAQVILNDAFVDFRASQRALKPGDAERITLSYPWIRGEAYDIELMTSTGATVGYEIEEAA